MADHKEAIVRILADVEAGTVSVEEGLCDAYYVGLAQSPNSVGGDAALLTALCAVFEDKAMHFAVPVMGKRRVSTALLGIVQTYTSGQQDPPPGLEDVAIVAARCLVALGVRGGLIDEVLGETAGGSN